MYRNYRGDTVYDLQHFLQNHITRNEHEQSSRKERPQKLHTSVV